MVLMALIRRIFHGARVGDVYAFRYSNEPKFDVDLTVIKVDGRAADDLVFFHDGTHSKQKHLRKLQR